MRASFQVFTLAVLTLTGGAALAADFSGTWGIDLRTPAERNRKAECGSAHFVLTQVKDQIVGSHSFGTVDCGRTNEGGNDTVKGIVIGDTAVLVLTSGRNGAIVLGVAKLDGDLLRWETRETIRPGEPEGDSPLILGRGTLHRESSSVGSQPN